MRISHCYGLGLSALPNLQELVGNSELGKGEDEIDKQEVDSRFPTIRSTERCNLQRLINCKFAHAPVETVHRRLDAAGD